MILSGIVFMSVACTSRPEEERGNSPFSFPMESMEDTASPDSMCWERWLLQQDTLKASEESVPAPRKRIHIDMPNKGKTRKRVNIYDYYQDHLDDYQADPEDEITFDPEIFDFLDD